MHQQVLDFVDQLPFVISSPIRASHTNLTNILHCL